MIKPTRWQTPLFTERTAWVNKCLATTMPLLGIFAAWSFSESYFLDDHLFWERAVVAAMALYLMVNRVGRSPAIFINIENILLLFSAATIMTINFIYIKSLSLNNYTFLMGILGMTGFYGGPSAARWMIRPVGAVALLVYPPHIVFEPLSHGLLALVIAGSAQLVSLLEQAFLGWLDLGITFHGHQVLVQGNPIDFVHACSGIHFMMVYAAFILLIPAIESSSDHTPTPARRVLAALGAGLALAYVMNILRIILILMMARFGQWDFALYSGHNLIGQIFIGIGLGVIVLARKIQS